MSKFNINALSCSIRQHSGRSFKVQQDGRTLQGDSETLWPSFSFAAGFMDLEEDHLQNESKRWLCFHLICLKISFNVDPGCPIVARRDLIDHLFID